MKTSDEFYILIFIILFEQVLVSRLYRDLRLFSIGGGADEVMLSVICKYMNTLPHVPLKKVK